MHLAPSNSQKYETGFTLIELVGTLAILTLLAWMASDTVFLRIKDSQRQDEAARLAVIAGALVRGVTHQHIIPADTNWSPLVGFELAEPASRVMQNQAGWNRRLLFDPEFRVGSPLAHPPYTQTVSGSMAPTNACAVLLSTLAADFPNLGSVQFEDLWQCPPGRLPTHWSSRWAGQPADLLIERINLAALFHRVCLNNLNLDSVARYAVDSTNQTGVISAGGRIDAIFLVGTRLFLLSPDDSVQACEQVSEPVSFAFEGGRWERSLLEGPANSRGPLAAVFDQFARAPAIASGVVPSDVALAMHELAGEYVKWASAGFPRSSDESGRPAAYFRRITEAQARLVDHAELLLESSPP